MAPFSTVVMGFVLGSIFHSAVSVLTPCKGSEKYLVSSAEKECGRGHHLAYIETAADLGRITNSCRFGLSAWIGGNFKNSGWNWADDWRPLREQGCYNAASGDEIQVTGAVTADSCLNHCQKSSYTFAGIMNQTTCICSNVPVKDRQQLNATQCSTSGCNETGTCGVSLLSIAGTPTQWADHEPVPHDRLFTKCVVMTSQEGYQWAMKECKESQHFICQNGTGELMLGGFATSWFEARNWCTGRDSDLVTIKDDEKQKRVVSFLTNGNHTSADAVWIGAKRFHLYWGPDESKDSDMRFVAVKSGSDHLGHENGMFFLIAGFGTYFSNVGSGGKSLCQKEALTTPTTAMTTAELPATNATDHPTVNTKATTERLNNSTSSTQMTSKPDVTSAITTAIFPGTGGPESTTSFGDAKAAKTTGEIATEYAAVIAVIILFLIIILSVVIVCIHQNRRRHRRLHDSDWQVSFDSNLNSIHMEEKPMPSKTSKAEDNIYDNSPGMRGEQPTPVENAYVDMSTLKRENEGQDYVAMDLPSGGSTVPPVIYSRKDNRMSGVYDNPNEMNQYVEPEQSKIPRSNMSPQRNPLYDKPYTDWGDDDSLSSREGASIKYNDAMESSYSEIPRTVL